MSQSAKKQVNVLRKRLAWLKAPERVNTGHQMSEAHALTWAIETLEPIAGFEDMDVAMYGRHGTWKRAVAALFGAHQVEACIRWIAEERIVKELAREATPA